MAISGVAGNVWRNGKRPRSSGSKPRPHLLNRISVRFALIAHVDISIIKARHSVMSQEAMRLVEAVASVTHIREGEDLEKAAVLVVADMQAVGIRERVVVEMCNTLASLPDNCVKLLLYSNAPSKRHARLRSSASKKDGSISQPEVDEVAAPDASDEDDEGEGDLPETGDGVATFRQSTCQKAWQLASDRQMIGSALQDAFGIGRARQSSMSFVMVYDVQVLGRLTTEGSVLVHSEAILR